MSKYSCSCLAYRAAILLILYSFLLVFCHPTTWLFCYPAIPLSTFSSTTPLALSAVNLLQVCKLWLTGSSFCTKINIIVQNLLYKKSCQITLGLYSRFFYITADLVFVWTLLYIKFHMRMNANDYAISCTHAHPLLFALHSHHYSIIYMYKHASFCSLQWAHIVLQLQYIANSIVLHSIHNNNYCIINVMQIQCNSRAHPYTPGLRCFT